MSVIKTPLIDRASRPFPLLAGDFAGHFFGSYRTGLLSHEGPDYGKKCFIFAGQGAAKPGMMRELYDGYALFRKRFEIADELAKHHRRPAPSDYILEPNRIPKGQLAATRVLCLLAAEYALYELLLAHYQRPAVLTAHSFGEQPALVAAGIFTFEQMFEIVHHREQCSPAEHELGYLMVVYAAPEAIDRVLDSAAYHIANLNAPLETVIAIGPDRLKATRQALKAEGIKSNPLRSVPHPYHSPAMQGVSDAMAAFLERTRPACQSPRVPLYSGVTGKLLDAETFAPQDAYDIIIKLSHTQIDFIQQIRTLHKLGFAHYLEIGPRTVCATFVRDILPETDMISRYAGDELETKRKTRPQKSLDRKSRSFLGVINKVIGKVTGYQIEGLSVEDRYQDELGIDSIKKAEIIVTVLDELSIDAGDQLDTVGIETVGDMVDYLKEAEEAPAATPTAARESSFERMVQRWVASPLESIFIMNADTSSLPLMVGLADIWRYPKRSLDVFKKELRADQDLILLADAETFASDSFAHDDFEASLKRQIYPLIDVIRGMLDADLALPTLFLISRGRPHPFVQALNGLLKSVRKETASMQVKSLQVDAMLPDEELQRLIRHERMAPDVDIRYMAGRREVLKLVPEAAAAATATKSEIEDYAVIVALGGAKGITFSLMKSLATRPRIRLHLAGRSAHDDLVVDRHLAELRAAGADVTYAKLDATDGDAVMALLADVKMRHGRIDLLINGVGTLSIDRLQDKTAAAIDHEFLNKVLPARHALAAARHHGIRRVIQFSSILARYGGVGQSIYSAANALIDGLTEAHNRTDSETAPSALAINWPPWDETGMTANPGVLTKLREFGLGLLNPDDAGRLFEAELGGVEENNVFYVDRTDEPLYAATPAAAKRAERLVGSACDRADRQYVPLKKTFTLERDSYLLEHRVKDIPCVPAAAAIAMLHTAARLHLDRTPELNNVHARNPILVNDQATVLLETDANGEGFSLCLRSSILHFVAEAKALDETIIPGSAIASSAERKLRTSLYPGKKASADSVYHGPCFQLLERPILDASGLLRAEIDDLALTDIFGDRPYSRLALWIDAAFQALGFLAFERDGVKTLPSKVGRLVTGWATPTDRLLVQARIDAIEEGGINGAAMITTAEGDAVLSMTDITMAATVQSSEQSATASSALIPVEA